jgi:hypothetical protein
MIISILTTIFKRKEITLRFLNHLKCLQEYRDDITIDVTCVISEDSYYDIIKSFGFNIVIHPNKPLGKKWNAGLKFLKTRRFDKLLILGSDDFINLKSLDLYYIKRKASIIVFSDLFLFETNSNKVKYLDNFIYPRRVIGAGMLIDEKIVKKCDYKLWNSELNQTLDTSLIKRINSFYKNIKLSYISIKDGAFICDVKNGRNIHGFNSFKLYETLDIEFMKKNTDVITFNNITNMNKLGKTLNMDVVIPYITSKNEELRYALRSINRNAEFKCRIVIIGNKPDFIKYGKNVVENCSIQEIVFVPSTRNGGFQFANCSDANIKMNSILLNNDISDNFIITYDDIYFIKKISLLDLQKKYILQSKELKIDSNYRKLKALTMNLLAKQNLPFFNFETHLPRFINKAKMKIIYNKFKPLKNLLLHFTLYGNFFLKNYMPIIVNKKSKIKAGFYGFDDEFSYNSNTKSVSVLKTLVKKHKFLNHNDNGLSANLQKVIHELFITKTQFEKDAE